MTSPSQEAPLPSINLNALEEAPVQSHEVMATGHGWTCEQRWPARSPSTIGNLSSRRASGSRVRTSQSHPLRIDAVKAGSAGGVIGITFCPGKRGASAQDHRWERSLDADLDVIAGWRPTAIVTLIEDHEFDMLDVPDLGERIRALGIDWHHLPIVDVRPPDSRFETGWQSGGPRLTGLLREGKKVLVHCRGGLGRAGMVAALLLIEMGADANDAIRSVRAARPGAIETPDQWRYVMDWPHRTGTSKKMEPHMDWFKGLFGFHEGAYEHTQSQFEVDGRRLRSKINGQAYGIGELELVSLQTLRERGRGADIPSGRLQVRIVTGDVRAMHQAPENAGALFQVASQFNLLEMISPDVSPEHGVTRYQFDRTQGPACAMAAGAATVYRNYFAPVKGGMGQTAERQLDGLADLGAALGAATGRPVDTLWRMRNGYALCTRAGLELIAGHLDSGSPEQIDTLRATLRIGVHWDVEVTDGARARRPAVSQAFCSALPVAYCAVPRHHWRAFASLVLEAAYEATLWAAVENTRRGGSNVVLLTRLGGGAFGNDDDWIDGAIRRSLQSMQSFDIDVRLVSYGPPSDAMKDIVCQFA